MPFEEHTSFTRPTVAVKLWRYMDLPKFLSILTSQSLWLTNAEILAVGDPHEGTLSTWQFFHRQWKAADEVPKSFLDQIVLHYSQGTDGTAKAAFEKFYILNEQLGILTHFWRRNYFISCWHAADHESIAMWKIYGSPGPGIAVISNGARLETALSQNAHRLYLGYVRYFDEIFDQIDSSNGLNAIISKRKCFSYEREVRLVYWDFANMHDPLQDAEWNEATRRFSPITEDTRPLVPGISLRCDLSSLIETVVISPDAPPWYQTTLQVIRDKLGFTFPISTSTILSSPSTYL